MPFDQSDGIASLDSLRSKQVTADSSGAVDDNVLDLTAAFKEHKEKGAADKKTADNDIQGLVKNRAGMSDEDFNKKLDDALAKRRHAEYKENTFDSYLSPAVDAPPQSLPLGGNDQTSYA